MYERKLGDRLLTLGNNRWKFEESLVLYDVETGTQWIQASGKALRGELAPNELKLLPAELTRLAQFRKSHPDATVLTGPRPNAPRNRIYLLDRDRLAELLLVGRVGTEARGYPFDALDRHGMVEDELGGTPIVAVFSRDPDLMRVYRRDVGGKTLALELIHPADAVVLRERAGTREWDAATGRPLGDASQPPLEALPAVPMLRDRLSHHFRRASIWAETSPPIPGK